jgi:hypothetical protein
VGYCPTNTDTFNVNTKLYNYMFGVQLPYRKFERYTPFAEALYGRANVRGTVPNIAEASTGRSIIAGGGVDYNINPRFALRVKADYLSTGVFKLKQDNLRVSIGIVIRSVHKKKRTLEDEEQPTE